MLWKRRPVYARDLPVRIVIVHRQIASVLQSLHLTRGSTGLMDNSVADQRAIEFRINEYRLSVTSPRNKVHADHLVYPYMRTSGYR
jgi:hypothetical protein